MLILKFIKYQVGKKKIFGICFLLFLFAFFLRCYAITSKSIWYDECVLHNCAAKLSFSSLFQRSSFFAGMSFFMFLLKGVYFVFGALPILGRLVSCFIGALSPIVLYLLSKRLYSVKVAIVASLLFCVSPVHVFYSQEIAGYSLFLLSFLSCIYSMLVWKENRSAGVFAFVLTTGFITIAVHPAGAVLVYPLLYIVITERNDLKFSALGRRAFLWLILINVGFGILAFILFRTFINPISINWLPKDSFMRFSMNLMKTLSYGGAHFGGADFTSYSDSPLVTKSLLLSYLFFALIGASGFFKKKEARWRLGFLFVWSLFSIGALFFLFRIVFGVGVVERYFLFVLPVLFILVALGLFEIRLSQTIRYFVLLFFIGMNFIVLKVDYYDRDLKIPWIKIYDYISKHGYDMNDVVVFEPHFQSGVLAYGNDPFSWDYKQRKECYKQIVSFRSFQGVISSPDAKYTFCNNIQKTLYQTVEFCSDSEIFVIVTEWSLPLSVNNYSDYYAKADVDEMSDLFYSEYVCLAQCYYDHNNMQISLDNDADFLGKDSDFRVYVGVFKKKGGSCMNQYANVEDLGERKLCQ